MWHKDHRNTKMENKRLHSEGKQELANTKDKFNKMNGEYNELAAEFRELEVKDKDNDEPELLKQQLIDQTERNEAHVKSLIADQEFHNAKYIGLVSEKDRLIASHLKGVR